MLLRTVTPATALPHSLEEIRHYLRVTSPDEDTHIEALYRAALEALQDETGLQLLQATFELSLPAFPSGREIRLPRGPAINAEEGDIAVAYTDPEGTPGTMAWAEIGASGWILYRLPEIYWPSTRAQPDAVRVTFKAGHAAASIPEAARVAVLLRTALLYEQRSPVSEVPLSAVPDTYRALRDLVSPQLYF